jgi:RAB6A-GEF complex partner protein 2
MASNSNIRVFVQWSEQTVFSGEDIECQITFRNVSINNVSTPLPPSTGLNGHPLNWGKQRKTAPMQAKAILNKNHIITDTRTMPVNRGHRARLSLNLPTRDRISQRDSVLRNGVPTEGVTKEHSHRPSVSIISLGIFEGVGDEAAGQLSPRENPGTSRGHTRASSLQFIPRRSVADVNGPIPGRLLSPLREVISLMNLLIIV